MLNLIIQNSKNKSITQQKNKTFNQTNPQNYQIKTNKLDKSQNNINLKVSPINESKLSVASDENEVGFTGVKEEPVPKEETDKLDQQNKLINQLPIDNDFFRLDFDYRKAFFIVRVKEPKEKNQKKFEDWLKENYPLISKDQFIFQ